MPKGKTNAGKRSFNFNPENEAKIVTLPPELLQYQVKYSSQRNIINDKGDHAAPEVQEDVPKKSSALVVGAKVSSKRSTISTVTGHQSLSYAKPSYATKESTLGDGSSGKSNTDEGECHSIYVRNLSLEANYRQIVKGLKNFGLIKSVRIHAESNNMSECCSADVEFDRATSKQKAIEASPIKIGGCLAVISEKRGTGLTQVDSNRSSSSGRNKSKNSRSKTTSGGHKDCRNPPKGSRK